MYTPATLNRSRPAPLVVMLHGCGTTAEQMEAAAELDQQAERDHFVVMYPDAAAHRGRCWRAATDTTRRSRDPAAIAGMVRDALARRAPAIDPTRVYVTGMSSGASMTGVLGATHPDLFAAIAIDAGCAYGTNPCGGRTPSQRSGRLARAALATMGARARVMPVLAIQGDRDDVVPGHSRQVLEQWRMTDNLVASGRTAGPIAALPTRTREVRAHREVPEHGRAVRHRIGVPAPRALDHPRHGPLLAGRDDGFRVRPLHRRARPGRRRRHLVLLPTVPQGRSAERLRPRARVAAGGVHRPLIRAAERPLQ